MLEKTKKCPKCKKDKELSEFYANKHTKSGLASWCKDCGKKKMTEYHKEHREKHNNYQAEYRLRNLETIKAKKREYRENHREKLNARGREYKKLHPQKRDVLETKESRRKGRLKLKYGITVDDWNHKFVTQGGRCLICGKHQDELSKSLAVDHDHRTGAIRGLLCSTCNSILGFAGKGGDSIMVLANAIKYLQERSL